MSKIKLVNDVIETQRLLIRRLAKEDVAGIFKSYASDPDVARYMVWPVAQRSDDLNQFVSSAISNFDDGSAYEYVIVSKVSNTIIGGCGMHRYRERSDSHFVFGYCLEKASWGKGYATEVAKMFSEWFRSQPTVFRLAAWVDVENIASARVLEKAGFECEGVLRRWMIHPNISTEPRDVKVYSLVK